MTRQRHRRRAGWAMVAVPAVIIAVLVGYALADHTIGGLAAQSPSGTPEVSPSTLSAPLPSSLSPVPPSADSTPSPSPLPPSPAPTPTTAAVTPTSTPNAVTALLATIPVKGRAPATGYDGSQAFWGMWAYPNGCSTRNLILARDLTQVTYRRPTSCVVNTGVLDDPYTGATVEFRYGTAPGQSDAVQIDHVVSRQNAWVTGAFAWTPEQRAAFANDPLDLLAVGGAVNQAKGNGDAATWLPPNKAFRCRYVTIQVQVKAAYGLWMTRAEHDAIATILATC